MNRITTEKQKVPQSFNLLFIGCLRENIFSVKLCVTLW